MSSQLLLKSKLLIPEIPQKNLYCKRIKDLHIAKYRLMIIHAPAGFGKTTSVLLSLQKQRKHTRWYRLEKEDNFLPIFYSHLIKTLLIEDSDLEPESIQTLKESQDLEKDYTILNAQIIQDSQNIFQNRKQKLYLVLDDYHNIVENHIIRESIQYFIINLPDCISIIITSRCDPYIIDSKLAVRKDIMQIGSNQLIFSKEETEELIRAKYKLHLSDKQMDFVYQNAEGWIAGIYILCHGMDILNEDLSSQEVEKSRIFSRFLYKFLQEIGEKKRNILIRISLWEDFSAEEIKDIFQIKDIIEFIRWLESSNLYIQKISSQPARYRFHALFREELERIFYETLGREERIAYFKELAHYYVDMDYPKSIRFYQKADLKKLALKIAQEKGREYFLMGKPEEMFYILNEFSNEDINNNPYLLLFRGMLYMNLRKEESLADFIRAMDGFRIIKDYSFLMNTYGMLLVVAYQTNDFTILKDSEKRLPLFFMSFSGKEVLTKLIIGIFISKTGEDNLRMAMPIHWLLNRMNITEDMWHYSYLMIRGIYYYRKGDLMQSYENLKNIIAHPIGKSNAQWRIIGLVSCCNLLFLRRDAKGLRDFADEFLLLGEKYNSDFSFGYGYYILAFEKYQKLDIIDALEALDNSIYHFKKYGGELLVQEREIIRFLWDDRTITPEEITYVETLTFHFEKEIIGHGVLELAQAVTGVLYKRIGNYKKAEEYLLRSLKASIKKGAKQSMAGLYMQLADFYQIINNDEKARAYRENWYKISQKEGYIFWKEVEIGLVQRICAAYQLEEKDIYLENLEKLYQTEKLETITKDLKIENKIQIKLFGHFQIIADDFKLEDKDFKTRKISGILKYILTYDKKVAIPREKLASIFWPDAENKSASTSLRVALYELRKLLAAMDIGLESENAIIYEKKEGFYRGDSLVFEKDTEIFEKKYREYQQGKYQTRLSILEEIYDLYQGEFFLGEEYDDRILVLREHYSSIFFECLYEMVDEYLKEESYDKAEECLLRGLLLDPYSEKCCMLLVKLYHVMHQDNRAEMLEKQFKRRYQREME